MTSMVTDNEVERVLRDHESGAMDAAGTIEDLVAIIDRLAASDRDVLVAENARLREALERAVCKHDWEWIGTSVDMSNTNFARFQCKNCGITKTTEQPS